MRKGYSRRAIAKALHKSFSAVAKEIKRNSVKGVYDPKKAHEKARKRRKEAQYQGMKIVECPPLKKYVDDHLYAGQSPEMISGRLSTIDTHLPYVSKNAIYSYLDSNDGKEVASYRQQQKGRKTRKDKGKKRFTNDPDKASIHERPLSIEGRTDSGDMEADFIISGRNGSGRILVVVDRVSRMTFLELLPKPTIRTVHNAFVRIKKRYPGMRSITLDNDVLFQRHKELAQLLGTPIYFCDPYASWQKGTVENTNKHLRKHLPKGTNLSSYTKKEIRGIEEKLNNRILKVLNYHTPTEAHTLFEK